MIEHLLDIKTFCKKYENLFREQTIYKWIKKNYHGFTDSCVVRIGTRIRINDMCFVEWLKNNSK